MEKMEADPCMSEFWDGHINTTGLRIFIICSW